MNAKEYKERFNKTITCPSGLQLQIRKLQSRDFLALGTMPELLSIKDKEKNMTSEEMAKFMLDNKEQLEKFYKVILLNGVLPNQELVLVDKLLGQTAENELGIEELDDADAIYIMQQIMKLSGGGGVKDISSFHTQPLADDSGSDGTEVWGASEPIAEP